MVRPHHSAVLKDRKNVSLQQTEPITAPSLDFHLPCFLYRCQVAEAARQAQTQALLRGHCHLRQSLIICEAMKTAVGTSMPADEISKSLPIAHQTTSNCSPAVRL